MSNVLIFVEQAGGELKKASLSAITFGQELAAKRGSELHLALVGAGLDAAADAAKGFGAAKVHVVDNACFENYQAESYVEAIAAVAGASSASMVSRPPSTSRTAFNVPSAIKRAGFLAFSSGPSSDSSLDAKLT